MTMEKCERFSNCSNAAAAAVRDHKIFISPLRVERKPFRFWRLSHYRFGRRMALAFHQTLAVLPGKFFSLRTNEGDFTVYYV
jgi:hypothetical protein